MSDTPSPTHSQTAIKGTLWTYAAFYSGKTVVFLSTVVLARLLTKDDFGVVGFVVIIMGFLDIVKDLGIGAAVIYYRQQPRTASTAFWLGLVISIVLCGLVWISAPFIGVFFNDPRTIWVTRLLSLNFPISALGNIQEALLIKDLAFGKKFLPDFAQAMTKGILSIILAVAGLGPLSLIIGHLSGTFISVLVVWRLVPWKPSLEVSREIARDLLRFGLPIVGVNGIGVFVLNLDYLLVGRYLGSEALGGYTLAFRIPELVILQFCSIVAQVVFPMFAKLNDDLPTLTRGYLKTTRYVSLITVPFGLGMALLSDPFIRAIFSDKWLDVVPVMQAISLYALFLSLGFNAGDVYKAIGKPAVLTYISLAKAVVLTPGLLWAVLVPKDILHVGYVQIVVAIFGSFLNLVVARAVLKVAMLDLLKPYVPAFAAGSIMAVCVYGINTLLVGVNPWLQLVLVPLAGGAVYVNVLWWMQRELVSDTLKTLRAVLVR